MKPWARWVVGGVLGTVAIAFGVHEWTRAGDLEAWRDRTRRTADRVALRPTDLEPRTVGALVRAAVVCMENLLPPDYARAEALLAEAIPRDPLRSDLWMRLAQAQLFQGKADLARVSLERSDTLDPNYPEQRFEAVNLWLLLGEPERAEALALRLSNFDWQMRRAVVRTLRSNGYSAARTYEVLKMDGLPVKDVLQAWREMRLESPKALSDLYPLIPAAQRNDPKMREQLGVLMSTKQTFAGPQLADLWLRGPNEQAPTEFLRPQEKGLLDRLPLVNRQLTEPPFTAPFALGWRPLFPSMQHVKITYQPPGGRGDAATQGRLVMTVNDSLAGTAPEIRWAFHGLAVPKGAGPLRIRVRVQADPPNASSLTLLVESFTQRKFTMSFDPRAQGEQVLEVQLARFEEAEALTMFLVRERRGGGSPSGTTRIVLSGLEVEEVKE